MIKPTIHLNGTSADELLRQYRMAAGAVQAAQEALAKIAPHGRDYYPQGDKVIYAAMDEHQARQAALSKIYDDLFELWNHVVDHKR